MKNLGACALYLTTLSILIATAGAAGNTTCKTDSLDWYTNIVGETPCTTYQRLRQICNSAYEVGSVFNPPNPNLANHCDDQLSGCCCNSVSYSLMMLCLNCQQGTGSGQNNDYGIDGPDGLYEVYLNGCSPIANSTLPSDIQWAVCNDKIKIEDDLYNLFWGDGDWYYMITRETIEKDQQAYANNTFTHCSFSVVDNSTHPTNTSSKTNMSSIPTGSSLPGQGGDVEPLNFLSGGAIAGIIIGSVAPMLLLAGFLFWYFCYRRKSEWKYTDITLQPFFAAPVHEPPTSYHPQPLTPGAVSVPSTPSFSIPYTDVPSTAHGPVRSSTILTQTGGVHLSASPVSEFPFPGPTPPTAASSSERHMDAGFSLGRSESGRLPPAYGDQKYSVRR